MFNLLNTLSELDKKRIENYIDTFELSKDLFIGTDKWLEQWSYSNRDLYHALGNKLIVQVPFEYKRDVATTKSLIKENLHNHSFYINWLDFCHSDRLEKELFDIFNDTQKADCTRFWITRILNLEELFENKISYNLKFKRNNKKNTLQISSGMKPIKACQKIINYFSDIWTFEGFEDFRLEHSMIFNENVVKGELNISIHPLDFMTMSDNFSNWSSCMSWSEEGCYRVGTVEMMNSNNVVCCYLTDKYNKDFVFHPLCKKALDKSHYCEYNKVKKVVDINDFGDEYKWNNKKYRQLFYVNKDIIMGGKAYPYNNINITKKILDVIKNIVKKNIGWDYTYGIEQYNDMRHVYGINCMTKQYTWAKIQPKKHNIIIDTKGMYNDIINDHYTKYFCYRNKVKKNKILSVSGKTCCLKCGEPTIYKAEPAYNDYEGEYYDEPLYNDRYGNCGNLLCPDCEDELKCSCCCQVNKTGKFYNIHSSKTINAKFGYNICPNCWERIKICPCCGEPFFVRNDNNHIIIQHPGRDVYEKNISTNLLKFCKWNGEEKRSYDFINMEDYNHNDYEHFNLNSHFSRTPNEDRLSLRTIYCCKDCNEKLTSDTTKAEERVYSLFWGGIKGVYILLPEYKELENNMLFENLKTPEYIKNMIIKDF